MPFGPTDRFFRRLLAGNHFRKCRPKHGNAFRLSTSVFKYTSRPIGNGRIRTSIEHEAAGNPATVVAERYRAMGGGLGAIAEPALRQAGAIVALREEDGNPFHCDLDFEDSQEVILILTEACELLIWPPALEQDGATLCREPH